ncbi:MAG: hypothetical protein VCB26_01925 [Candidatus Hydrogenedentota bacterium]
MSETTRQSNSTATADLQLLYSTSVEPDQIDQLGHMNVRFYGVHALAGARELIDRLGMPSMTDADGARAAFTDLYTRHYLEQLEGAPLEVWGGVLEVRESEVQTYYELRNPVRDEIGATFVFTVQYQNGETHKALPLSQAVSSAANSMLIHWPEHGKPRSVSLDSTPSVLSLEDVHTLNIESRDVRVISPADCDANSVYRIDSFQDLVWGSEGISEDNDWLRNLENGDKMGWATMESRCTLIELPRAGTRVQSFRATVDISRKAQHERFWVFDIDRSVLLCTASFVDVAFNINTRSAIEIPAFERDRMAENYRPELA